MALLNVSQYTRMVSLTKGYVHMMTGHVFISIHYLELMIINYGSLANARARLFNAIQLKRGH